MSDVHLCFSLNLLYHIDKGNIKMYHNFNTHKKLVALLLTSLTVTTALAQPIVTDSTSRSVNESTSNSTTTVKSPPPTAVAPAITVINSDVCAVGVSGAAQTQILGISFGTTMTDKNCERLKLARSTYDMGMKVAAVAIMCQDERVFTAMMNAGTPCPVDGKIGEQAKKIWEDNPERAPQKVKSNE
jgi:hypothetical protein